ncbi:MAG: tetratricopeptide repeat protein [Edaphobacter sp.]
MRFLILSAVLALPAAALTQTKTQTPTAPHPAADGKVHCTIQPPPAPGEALTALVAGNTDRAETLYAAQVASSPSPAAYAGLARAQLAANKLSQALSTAKSALAFAPASAEVQSLTGDVLLRSGQIPEAGTAYTRALALDGCSARGHYGMGLVNQLLSRRAAADHELDLARKLSPGDPEIMAAYITTLPEADRAAPLNAFLAAKPQLTPDRIEALTNDLAILQAHKFCSPVEPFQTAKLNFTPVMFNGTIIRSWGFSTKFNNADTLLLELDSSVSGILLDEKQAAKAGVQPITPGATTVPYTGFVNQIRIGSIQYHDCPVRVVDSSTLAKANGLIGLDLFRDHLIHIDYPDQSVTLSALPAEPLAQPTGERSIVTPTDKDWSQIYVDGSNILVPTLINKQGPFLFVLDTGAPRTVLSPDVTSRTLDKSSDATVPLQGTSGTVVKFIPKEGGGDLNRADIYSANGTLLKVSRPVKFPLYRFAGSEVPNRSAVTFDLTPKSHATGVEVSGLLGFDVLRQFIIDINYRDGIARILFDQNRRYAVQQADKTYLGNYY